MIYYETKTNKNASLTCRHFGITRSLWYNWKNRFDQSNLMSSEDKSTTPFNKRKKNNKIKKKVYQIWKSKIDVYLQ